ncbi:MAG: S41 family peptidase [Myxococcales bacterium]|nr:S41 family peptidase [Myxococcales bacterium]MDH3484675.1 S41 family peptidase [Myxococcales bacterium]
MSGHKTSHKKRLVIVGLLALALVVVTASEAPARRSPFQPLTIFARALAYIEVNYVEPVDQKSLVYGAIRGLTEALDPHSVFLEPEDYVILESDAEGRFAGIGVEVSMRDGWLTILTVFESGPADKAGLEPGDRFLTIEGKEARDIRLYDAVRMIRGEPGTEVTVTIRREGTEEAIERKLRRAFIDVDPIDLRYLENRIVYVQIRAFQEDTAELLSEALDQAVTALHPRGGIEGLLLDLRDNGGGLLREAVLVSDEFLSSGVVLTTRSRGGELIQEFSARKSGTRPKWPMVILINEQTASAAEIVAGALSDHKRAVLVGTRTFGKGSVQNIFELPDGSALKLTIARYYTPSGQSIQAQGISPDIVAEQPKEEGMPAPIREEELEGHLVAKKTLGNRRKQPATASPTGQLQASTILVDDPQAQRGYQALQELIRR